MDIVRGWRVILRSGSAEACLGASGSARKRALGDGWRFLQGGESVNPGRLFGLSSGPGRRR